MTRRDFLVFRSCGGGRGSWLTVEAGVHLPAPGVICRDLAGLRLDGRSANEDEWFVPSWVLERSWLQTFSYLLSAPLWSSKLLQKLLILISVSLRSALYTQYINPLPSKLDVAHDQTPRRTSWPIIISRAPTASNAPRELTSALLGPTPSGERVLVL